jgi:hypothetical protein
MRMACSQILTVIYEQHINPAGRGKASVPPTAISTVIRFGIVRLDDAAQRESRR